MLLLWGLLTTINMNLETFNKAKALIAEKEHLENLLGSISGYGFEIRTKNIVSELKPGAEKTIGSAIINAIKGEIEDIRLQFEQL